MINAVLYREGKNLTGCRLEGHSGWANAGEDIVCAAASILGCTCVNALESVCGVIPEITEYNEQKGVLAFELPEMTEEENGKAQTSTRPLNGKDSPIKKARLSVSGPCQAWIIW